MQNFNFCPNLIKLYPNFTKFIQNLPKFYAIYPKLPKFYPNFTNFHCEKFSLILTKTITKINTESEKWELWKNYARLCHKPIHDECKKQYEKFRQLPDEFEDIEKEWLLFRSAIIALAVESCG